MFPWGLKWFQMDLDGYYLFYIVNFLLHLTVEVDLPPPRVSMVDILKLKLRHLHSASAIKLVYSQVKISTSIGESLYDS